LPALVLKGFGGTIPRMNPRLLPDVQASEAWNCDLDSGAIAGLPMPKLIKDLTGALPGKTVKKAYRLPAPPPGGPDAWLPLPDEASSVVRSPLTNDSLHRIYWTNPNDGAYWSTYAMITAGTPPYNLGFIAPSTSYSLTVSASGGTTDGSLPLVSRTYLFTYIDTYGEESSPSGPSAVVTGASDGNWTISGIPTAPPAAVAGKNYPAVARVRLYRTVTGQNTGAQFYQVQEWPLPSGPAGGVFVDTIADSLIVYSNPLPSSSWASPPDGLDGLVAMTSGMLIGFTGNTVHFCEPNRPHAWPAAYDLSVQYQIVALAVWQQSLMILTQGYPSSGTGNTPANFVLSQIQVAEPCIARNSVVTDLLGVYYASQNGIQVLTYFGIQNQTLQLMSKNIWMNKFEANSISACRHRQQYLAVIDDGTGFIIDYAENRLGLVQLSTVDGVVSVWNDVYTGDAYMMQKEKVYLWDGPYEPPLAYRWKSKEFYLPAPVNFAVVQVSMSDYVYGLPAPPIINPLASPINVGETELPDGALAIFRVYFHYQLVYQTWLTSPRPIFKLPSGYKGFTWQFEIVARVPIYSIEIATTAQELKGV
jgi:hypothetical protein